MKRKSLILGTTAFALTSCALVGGCGGFEPTKEEYSKAFGAVCATLQTSTQALSMTNYPSTDFNDLDNNDEKLRVSRLCYLASEICNNENFTLPNGAFDFFVENIGGPNGATIKMEIGYTNGITFYQIIMTTDQDTSYEYLGVSVDYDYGNERLNSFVVEDYYNYSHGSSDFHYVSFDGNSSKILDISSESYISAKASALEKAESFLACEYTETQYNFTDEFNRAMQLN